jgi:predicted dinucleotide-binding enzyme
MDPCLQASRSRRRTHADWHARVGVDGRQARDALRAAASDADALLLAVHWDNVDDVLSQAGDLSGKVVVTCSVPMNGDDTGLVIGHTSSGAEALGTVRAPHGTARPRG